MEKTQSIEETILSVFEDGSKKIQASEQTREILRIMAAYRVIYGDLVAWLQRYWSPDGTTIPNEADAAEHWKQFQTYLEGWLLDSINEKTSSMPFDGI